MANLAGVSASSTIGTFSYSTSYYGNARLLQLAELYNTDLKPEQTITTDFSLSVEFFKRLTLDANIYRRETTDALLDVPVPLSNGFSTMKRNIGILRNEGFELSALVKLFDTTDWRMSLRGSLAYNRNKVVDLYHADRLYASEEAIVPDYEVGKSYDMIYGLKSLGINPITGLPVFLGADGSEVPATENPKKENIVALGHSTPPYSGTLNLSFSYREFDLDMDFYYVFGGYQKYNYSYVRDDDNANKNAIKGQLQNMWFQKGDEGKIYYSPFFSSSALASLTDYANTETVGKSDYLKLSMVSLRYRVPHAFLEKNCKFIKYANIAFQASNLFMITPYKESDPETGSLAGTMQPVLTINLSLTF
jgi:outer membrane receptor protein involved in Fe transport